MSTTTYAANIERQLLTGRERMEQLVQSFPALRGASGVKPWNAIKFAKSVSLAIDNTAIDQAAAFVLSVWNGHGGKVWFTEEHNIGPFDPVHALAHWDAVHTQAFIDWCNDPFWP